MNIRIGLAILSASVIIGGIACQTPDTGVDADQTVADALDALHAKASEADFDGYFALYRSDAIFLGTDGTERWTIDQFKSYARPSFESGRGWTYHPVSRNVYFSDDGRTAWFDETLDNENLGSTRGTGVLVRVGSDWKIVQYNLTIPIPNDLARETVARIREFQKNQ